MNAKLAKMVEDMKKQTIGVEIEMAGITRQEAAKVVAKYFGTERTVRHEAGSLFCARPRPACRRC